MQHKQKNQFRQKQPNFAEKFESTSNGRAQEFQTKNLIPGQKLHTSQKNAAPKIKEKTEPISNLRINAQK